MTARNKKTILAVSLAAIILAAAIAVIALVAMSQKSITIEGAEIQNTLTQDGIKEISASLSVDCNATEKDGYFVCKLPQFSGTYSGGDAVTISGEDVNDLTVNEGKLSFIGTETSYKKVAIREEKITSSSNVYTLIMKNKEDDQTILRYNLEVTTRLTDADDAIINAAPDQESIAKAVKTIDTITEVCILNEDTDPNNEIGKEGQYYIKISYIDNRVPLEKYGELDNNFNFTVTPESCTSRGSDAGGTIEVFRTIEEADKRKKYLDQFSGGILSAGKSKLIGPAVVRVSQNLKASEQDDLLEKLYQALAK